MPDEWNDTFASPGAVGSGFTLADHLGSLLLIEPLSVEVSVRTVHGDVDVIKANVAVIGGPGEGETFTETLIFGKLLLTQLRSKVGQKVLGRLGQGTAKPGQSPPWLLEDASDADRQIGVAHLSGRLATAAAPF